MSQGAAVGGGDLAVDRAQRHVAQPDLRGTGPGCTAGVLRCARAFAANASGADRWSVPAQMWLGVSPVPAQTWQFVEKRLPAGVGLYIGARVLLVLRSSNGRLIVATAEHGCPYTTTFVREAAARCERVRAYVPVRACVSALWADGLACGLVWACMCACRFVLTLDGDREGGGGRCDLLQSRTGVGHRRRRGRERARRRQLGDARATREGAHIRDHL